MELIFYDPYYDSDDEQKDYSSELQSLLAEFDDEVLVHRTDVGHGADCPAFLVQLFSTVDWPSLLTASGMGATFLMGKVINENLDAWIAIAKKAGSVISKLKPSRIDENAATLLAIRELHNNAKLSGEFSVSVQVIEYTPIPSGKFMLDKRPDALYLITINTGSCAYIYGTKSDGSVSFKHDYDLGWYDFHS